MGDGCGRNSSAVDVNSLVMLMMSYRIDVFVLLICVGVMPTLNSLDW